MPAGKYTVKLIKGSETYTSTVELIPDTRANYSADERALQQKSVRHLFDITESFTFLTQRVMTVRNQAQARATKLSGVDRKPLTDPADKADALYKTLVATPKGGWPPGEEETHDRLGKPHGAANIYADR